jgi:leucyl aminopeptidase
MNTCFPFRVSYQPPKFIVLEHRAARQHRWCWWARITFDTGGISPGAEMDEMKYDMRAWVRWVMKPSMLKPLNVVMLVPT